MTDEESTGAAIITIVACVATMFATGLLVNALTVSRWKQEAIAHGAAHYDPQSGEWQWNNPRKDK